MEITEQVVKIAGSLDNMARNIAEAGDNIESANPAQLADTLSAILETAQALERASEEFLKGTKMLVAAGDQARVG